MMAALELGRAAMANVVVARSGGLCLGRGAPGEGEEEAETMVYAAAVAVAWSGGTAVAAELDLPAMAAMAERALPR
jgi:hypothetical protein